MSARDREIVALEKQFKQAIRDAVNRPSRKPFSWGGLAGYRQLSAVAKGIRLLVDDTPESAYLRRLLLQVERALDRYRSLAQDLEEAHCWLRRIAAVLHYRIPPDHASSEKLTSKTVAEAMGHVLTQFDPDRKRQPAQSALYYALFRTWHAYGADLLHCYDIQGLPPDNLALEALFSKLRRHQRRISGRKSTQELRIFGHYQVLFQAENQQELLAQLRTVPLERYYQHRRLLDEASTPRRFLARLHRNPMTAIQNLTDAYLTRRRQLRINKQPLAGLLEYTS